jgi:hypothetical protein
LQIARLQMARLELARLQLERASHANAPAAASVQVSRFRGTEESLTKSDSKPNQKEFAVSRRDVANENDQ